MSVDEEGRFGEVGGPDAAGALPVQDVQQARVVGAPLAAIIFHEVVEFGAGHVGRAVVLVVGAVVVVAPTMVVVVVPAMVVVVVPVVVAVTGSENGPLRPLMRALTMNE